MIEMIVVVGIIAIVAAFAYPNYRNYVLEMQRSEGMAALQQAAARQERFFTNNSTYTTNVTSLGVSATTEHGHYAITASNAPCSDISQCYTLTATAQGGQVDDTGCTALTLSSTGIKTPAACW